MRKTFKLFCAAAIAALTVSSCGKIWDEFDSVHGQLDSIEARLDSLETALNSQVATINTTLGALAKADEALAAADKTLSTKLEAKDAELAEAIAEVVAALEAGEEELTAALEKLGEELGVEISTLAEEAKKALADAMAKVAVQKVVKNEAGNYVLTFADGSTLEVAAADANANNTDLVTVVDGEWHVVLADGTTESLGVPVGHVDLVFEVDYETKELLYSVDGGEKFEGTGAYVADDNYYLVTDFYEEENYVTICVGGVYYNLPKVSTAEALVLAGKTYFTAGQTKTVALQVKGIKSAFIASTPKGWNAELNFAELELTVTAPAGEGATEGNVEVWLLTEDGVVRNAVLPVVLGPAVVEITVDPKTNEVAMVFNEVDGETPEVIYGASLASEFNPEYILENLLYITYMGGFSNLDEENPDTAPKATEFEGTMDDLTGGSDYSAQYVVWAVVPEWKQSDYGYVATNSVNDFVKVYHKMNAMNFEFTPALSDVAFTVELLDPSVTGFYGFYANQYTWPSVKEMFEMGYLGIGDLISGVFGTELPCLEYEGSEFEGIASTFGLSEEYIEYGMLNNITPGSKPYIGIIPIVEGKEDYTFADVIVKEVSTKALVAGGTVANEITVEAGYDTFTLTVEAEDAAYMFYEVYPKDSEDIPATDADVLAAVSEYNIPDVFYDEYEGVAEIEHMIGYYDNPGDVFEVVLVLVSEDATCQVVRKEVATKKLPISEALSATIEAEFDANSVTVDATVTLTGAATKIAYACNTASMYEDKSLVDVLAGEWKEVEVEVDATTVDLTGLKVNQSSWSVNKYYVHVVVFDAEGNVSKICTSNRVDVPKKTN